MRQVLVATALLAAAAAPAAAQPEMCGVTFLRAPDEIRYVIEQWLRAEPRCSSTIELRVIPTDGGIYLLAQRPDGRIHERLVPDAQSAGVLVASWVADDGTGGRPAPAPAPAAAPPLTVIVDPLRVGPPGNAGVIATAPPPAPRGPGKWLSLGMIVQTDNESGGFRGEVELFHVGGMKLGAAIAITENHFDLMPGTGWDYAHLVLDDISVLATLTKTWRSGRWEARAGVGLGLVSSDGHFSGTETYGSEWQDYDAQGVAPVAELSGLVTRRLGRSFGLAVGPVITVVEQDFSGPAINAKIERSAAQVMVFGGLRYEL